MIDPELAMQAAVVAAFRDAGIAADEHNIEDFLRYLEERGYCIAKIVDEKCI